MTRLLLISAAVLLGLVSAHGTDTLEPLLRERAAAALGRDTTAVRLILADAPELSGPLSDYDFRFAGTPRGRTVVRATSPHHRDVAFSVDVELWADVAVAQRHIEHGSALAPEYFAPVRRNVTHLNPQPLDALNGLRARRNLAVGTVLTAEHVEPIPLIERGRSVSVLVESGRVRVMRSGVALRDAQTGESVRVRVDRRTVIEAIAAGPGLCRVTR